MIPKEHFTRQPAFTVIAASEAIHMPLGSNAVYLALYPGSASRMQKEKWAWGRGYCLLALWVQVWSFDFAQFFRYCMIWLLTLCMRTWHIVFVYQILLDSFALYSFLCLSILFYMASDAYSTYVYLHQEWSRVRETMHQLTIKLSL